ncbi:Acg family FMN-binding oxidoreductase [Pseudooceanicola sp. LIPI14-2-Ac024]|uniref:Acg family FMN-binding oxidoreductase n=1 Tax=Pseudooceanicola sp. LIPI14-2-Ac024 TaxID=3344875 RepID=UPI0035CF56D3
MHRRDFLAATGGTLLAAGCSGDASSYETEVAALRAPLSPEGGVNEMIRYATLAPNGHNTQSWIFTAGETGIAITPDHTRRTPVVDPDDHHVFVSLGAAARNLEIAGRAAGRPGEASVAPDGAVRFSMGQAAPMADPLIEAIRARQSTRTEYDGGPVGAGVLAALAEAGRGPGVRMVLIADPAPMASLRDIVVAGTEAQMADPAFEAELLDWLRFSTASAVDHRDGLYTAASGNPAFPDFIGRRIFPFVFTASGEVDKYAAQMESSAGAAVFLADAADPAHWVRVGMAAQGFLLEATRQGLATAFVNQPVEVPDLRGELAALAGEPGLRPDLVIRFGRAPRLPYSLRRPVADVMRAG